MKAGRILVARVTRGGSTSGGPGTSARAGIHGLQGESSPEARSRALRSLLETRRGRTPITSQIPRSAPTGLADGLAPDLPALHADHRAIRPNAMGSPLPEPAGDSALSRE